MDLGVKVEVRLGTPHPIVLVYSNGQEFNFSVERARDLIGVLTLAVTQCETRTDGPKWKKAKAGTALPGDSVIRYPDDDTRFGRVAIRDCEYITIAELNALPTEDVKQNDIDQ